MVFALTAVAIPFASIMAFSAVPTPLYVLYQDAQGLSSAQIAITFAIYGAGVILSLFLFGHVSDHVGRKRVLAAGLAVSLISASIFEMSEHLAALLVARLLCGVGVGLATSTATAFLVEIYRRYRPTGKGSGAEVLAVASNLGGVGLGPLMSAVIAEHSTEQTRMPYIVFSGILLIGLVLLLTAPETVLVAEQGWKYRPQSMYVPKTNRVHFFAVMLSIFLGFSMMGFFASLVPGFVREEVGVDSLVAVGASTAIVFMVAAICQIFLRTLRTGLLSYIGLVLLTAGPVTMLISISSSSMPLLVVAGAISGAGSGVVALAGISSVLQTAPATRRSEALASLFLFGYAGMGIPVVLIGLTLEVLTITQSVLVFTLLAVMTVAVILVLKWWAHAIALALPRR